MRASFGLPSVVGDEIDAAKWRKRAVQVRRGGRALARCAARARSAPSRPPASPPAAPARPAQVKYEIPYFTVSGIQVRYLKILEKSGYDALPWVRYITASGSCESRLG